MEQYLQAKGCQKKTGIALGHDPLAIEELRANSHYAMYPRRYRGRRSPIWLAPKNSTWRKCVRDTCIAFMQISHPRRTAK